MVRGYVNFRERLVILCETMKETEVEGTTLIFLIDLLFVAFYWFFAKKEKEATPSVEGGNIISLGAGVLLHYEFMHGETRSFWQWFYRGPAAEPAVGLPGSSPPTAGCAMEPLLHFREERRKKKVRKGKEEQERRKRAPPIC
jgi:hypothetical protein